MKGSHNHRVPVDIARLRELNRNGLPDTVIARLMGHDRTTITKYRKADGLPSHRFGSRHRAILSRIGSELQRAGRRPGICEAVRSAASQYASSSGWPKELSARATQLLNILAGSDKPMTKLELALASGTSVHNLEIHYLWPLAKHGFVRCLPRAMTNPRGRPAFNLYLLGPAAVKILEKRAQPHAAK